MRSCVSILLSLVALLLGVSVALAGWEWNARLKVEGADTRLRWTVTDGGDPYDYRAQMRLWLPEGADARVLSRMTDEENIVVLRDKHLSCRPAGVEFRAQVRILPMRHASGTGVILTIVADGDEVASASGGLNKKVQVTGLLPIENPACFAQASETD